VKAAAPKRNARRRADHTHQAGTARQASFIALKAFSAMRLCGRQASLVQLRVGARFPHGGLPKCMWAVLSARKGGQFVSLGAFAEAKSEIKAKI